MKEKLFESKYGYFTPDGREYVITQPGTPRPWVNIVSNGDYSFMISQTGAGYSWRSNNGRNQVTRTFANTAKDSSGKYIYIRDVNTKKFWSAAWKPVMAEYQEYEVRHGIGYTVFKHKVNDILSETKVFVVPERPVEIMQISITNQDTMERCLDISTFFEWGQGFVPDDHSENYNTLIDSDFDVPMNSLIAKKYLWNFADEQNRQDTMRWEYTGFHAASERIKSYDGDKQTFLGMCGTEEKPRAMYTDTLARNTGRSADAAAALQVEVALHPGEAKTIVFVLGAARNGQEDHKELIQAYCNIEAAEQALQDVQRFWSNLVDTEQVETPDSAMNIMTNAWLKYQSISWHVWGKPVCSQMPAKYGHRDQLQDSQIFLASKPELARKQILMYAAKQCQERDTLHWQLIVRGREPHTQCVEDVLWLPFILNAYIKETKDFSILDEILSCPDGRESTVYEQCKHAIEKVLERFSPRGVPLRGDRNWQGESFWLGEFLYKVLNEFVPLAQLRGDAAFAEKSREAMDTLEYALNQYGWDGEWYLQAVTEDGAKIGSRQNEQGQIFLHPQTWAVISGIAGEERAHTAMDAVTKHLRQDYGALLLYPDYTKVKKDAGYITRYAPAFRENCGIYSHAAAWTVWAYVLAGKAELAYQMYRSVCPPNRFEDIEQYTAEPYAMPGNGDGPISPYYRTAGLGWYTGSAQWLHRVATHWILGIRPALEGLTVSPCIPAEWDEFTYYRQFRGASYSIHVDNSAHVNSGIKAMYVDGRLVQGCIIEDFGDGCQHEVRVIMG